MPKIMVAAMDVLEKTQLEEQLTSLGYEVIGRAYSGESAVEKARLLRPDLILMDMDMPGKLDGIDAAETIKAELDIPVIFLNAYADDKYVERAKSIEPSGYIVKPFHESEIKAAIEVALYRKDSERRLREFGESKAVLLDGFFSDIMLFLYTKSVKKEHIFKGGIFAFDIENLNAERTKVLSEGIPRVVISTGEETTISFSTSSYQPESLDVVPQKIIEEIVRKSVEPLILSFLRKSMSGYDILKEIYDKFHVLLSQARVYSLLYDLEERGILKIKLEGKSKVYLPTEEGEKYIENKLKDFHVVYSHILGFER
jgi:AmiR/NasT family two-component response regulator/predicted transcriptional regulator